MGVHSMQSNRRKCGYRCALCVSHSNVSTQRCLCNMPDYSRCVCVRGAHALVTLFRWRQLFDPLCPAMQWIKLKHLTWAAWVTGRLTMLRFSCSTSAFVEPGKRPSSNGKQMLPTDDDGAQCTLWINNYYLLLLRARESEGQALRNGHVNPMKNGPPIDQHYEMEWIELIHSGRLPPTLLICMESGFLVLK